MIFLAKSSFCVFRAKNEGKKFEEKYMWSFYAGEAT
jgi:F0F1-type ATP synthase assembly protein I